MITAAAAIKSIASLVIIYLALISFQPTIYQAFPRNAISDKGSSRRRGADYSVARDGSGVYRCSLDALVISWIHQFQSLTLSGAWVIPLPYDPEMNALDRQSRLAAALRENLKRRKRQTRDRVREAHEVQVDASASSDAGLADANVDAESLSQQAKDGSDSAQG